MTATIVAIDGIDGAGITTLHNLLSKRLEEQGVRVIRSKEPGSGYTGGILRDIISGRVAAYAPGELPEMETLLFAVDRYYQMLHEVQWLRVLRETVSGERGTVVLKDRYYYTSLVYQSYGYKRAVAGQRDDNEKEGITDRGVENILRWIREVNAYAPPAHLVIYLDVDPRVAAKRIMQNFLRPSLNIYGIEELESLKRHASWFFTKWLPEHPEHPQPEWYTPLWLCETPGSDPRICLDRSVYGEARYPYILVVKEGDEIDPRRALENKLECILGIIRNIVERRVESLERVVWC